MSILRPLFVYGTLRDPELLAAVLGRPLRPGAMPPASAPGFRAVLYPGRVYPALVRTPGAAAPGLLLTDLTPFERDVLDAYEGDEYRRDVIPVITDSELHEVEAYFPVIKVPPDAAAWTLTAWQADHKPKILAADAAGAADLRARLMAIRPH